MLRLGQSWSSSVRDDRRKSLIYLSLFRIAAPLVFAADWLAVRAVEREPVSAGKAAFAGVVISLVGVHK